MITDNSDPELAPGKPLELPSDPLIASIDELRCFQYKMGDRLARVRELVSSGAFAYSSTESRKKLLDDLAEQADKIDDMSRAIIKGIRKVKRMRLRDDNIIETLVHSWALNGDGTPISELGKSDA